MDQLTAEKRLSLAYLFCVIFGGVSSITTGIAWGHWYRTLDRCVGRNCSCILYGQNSAEIFLGGGQAPCIWVTFGPLIYVFFCLLLTCFHGYRVLFTTKSPRTRTSRTMLAKMEPGETVQIHAVSQETTSSLPKAYWITCSVFSVIFSLYAVVHFAIYLDGYYTTCNEYRKMVEKLLGLRGSASPVVHKRLACQAIFDFMDYMQLDTGNGYRDGVINTGISLILGSTAAGLSWILFMFTVVVNIMLSRNYE